MKIMPSPLVRERNQTPLMPVTASASVDRVMCFCVEHTTNATRGRGPLETAYLEASVKGSMSRRIARRQGGQALTASASGLTTEEDEALQAWRAQSAIAETYKTQAADLLTELEA